MSRCILFVVLATFHGILPASAQNSERRVAKVGLVLSGGSARGLAHVGVLKVLEEERIPIDVVAGTSMGSIIGGLYAMGYSPAMIEDVALGQDWDRLFSDRASRRSEVLEQRLAGEGVIISLPFKGRQVLLPSGVFSGQQAMTALSRLSWGLHQVEDLAQLHLPFTAVATEFRTGDAVPLSNIPIAEAIRASMSLPSVFVPAVVNGELYIDGGLSRNIPAVDALDLGADVLIGVDVGAALDSASIANLSFVDVLVEAAFFQSVRYDAAQRAMIDVLIEPELQGLSRSDFHHVTDWISRGETAARAMVPRLRALMDSLGLAPAVYNYPYPSSPEPVFVEEITVRGVRDDAIKLVHNRLRLEEKTWLGPDDIESAIGRVYGTGLFDLVTYRVVPMRVGQGSRSRSTQGDDTRLWALDIEVVPRDAPNRIGVGFRHDSRYNTALLLDATLWSTDSANRMTSFRARFGEQLQFVASHSARSGRRSRFNLGGKVGYASAPVDMYIPGRYANVLGTDQDVPVFSIGLATVGGEFFVGFASRESVRTGIMARLTHVFIDERVAGQVILPDSLNEGTPAPVITDTDQDMVSGGVYLQFDTFDAVDFPTRGARVTATSEVGLSNAIPQVAVTSRRSGGLLDLGPFVFTAFRASWYVPINNTFSILGEVAGTYGSGERLPTHYYSFLGGRETVTVLTDAYIPMYGLRSQERFGRKAYMGLLGVQWEFRKDLFFKVFANGGDTFDLFGDDDRKQLGEELYDIITDAPTMGYGVEIGLRTRAGPLQLVVALGDRDEPLDVGIRFGFDF